MERKKAQERADKTQLKVDKNLKHCVAFSSMKPLRRAMSFSDECLNGITDIECKQQLTQRNCK